MGSTLIYQIDEEIFEKAKTIYRRYTPLSFTDSVSVAFMDVVGIEYIYSFDDGFDRVSGITRFNASVLPW